MEKKAVFPFRWRHAIFTSKLLSAQWAVRPLHLHTKSSAAVCCTRTSLLPKIGVRVGWGETVQRRDWNHPGRMWRELEMSVEAGSWSRR